MVPALITVTLGHGLVFLAGAGPLFWTDVDTAAMCALMAANVERDLNNDGIPSRLPAHNSHGRN